MMRYLFKRGEHPKHVYVFTEALAARSDMLECDSSGRPLDDQPPVAKKAAIGHVGIDVESRVEETPLTMAEDPADETSDAQSAHSEDPADESQAITAAIVAEFATFKATEVRARIKSDFGGAKVPAGLSKEVLIQKYIEMRLATA